MHLSKIIFRITYALLFALVSQHSVAQFNFEYNNELLVKKGSDTLRNAWAGGLNNIQISDFDYDFDGDMDLFIFDRSGNNIRVFTKEIINGIPRWIHAEKAKYKFPSALIYRATMVDYDSDGKKDLFTYSIGGLRVYRNIGNAVDGLQWELFQPVVNSDYNGNVSNLFVASSDVPAIVDVDFDGDIDILTFHQGGQHVEYHKNMSMEIHGIPDSLKFVLANECWGNFSENFSDNSLTLNDPDAPCSGNGVLPNPQKSGEKHAGSNLLALDIDNSGVMDLIIGDVSNTNLILVLNGGTQPNTNSSMVSLDASFPSNSLPVDLYLFPAAFLVDVDFDNIKDLVVGTSARNVSENETSIMFYKNTGSNAAPNFNFQTKSFLQNTMIEHGYGTVPIVFDLNNDGKKDLFVANFYRYKNETTKESRLAYYQNTGTNTNPLFTHVDSDFLNLSTLKYGLRLIPTFGDLNGDGVEDMLIGNEIGRIIRYFGSGTTFVNPTVNLQDNNGTIISVGSFAHPQLFDLDNDGKLDLIVGNKNGKIAYYRNVGTSSSASFQLITDFLGGVNVAFNGPDGYAAPHFFRQSGETYLFVGNLEGTLRYYKNIDDSLTSGGVFQLDNAELLGLNVESYSSFFVDDTDNDGFSNLFIGQELGGISLMEVDPNSSSAVEETKFLEALIYPNPTTNSISVRVQSTSTTKLQLLDLNGRLLFEQDFLEEIAVDVSNYLAGIYFIKLSNTVGSSSNHKVIKR